MDAGCVPGAASVFVARDRGNPRVLRHLGDAVPMSVASDQGASARRVSPADQGVDHRAQLLLDVHLPQRATDAAGLRQLDAQPLGEDTAEGAAAGSAPSLCRGNTTCLGRVVADAPQPDRVAHDLPPASAELCRLRGLPTP